MLGISKKGGERARKGNYWNFTNGERIRLEEDGRLPGDSSVTYLKFHPAAILIAGPVLGILYAAFLPFIGIAMLLQVTFEKVMGGIMAKAGSTATFSWSPVRAYLTGKKRKEMKEKAEKEKKESKEEGSE